MVGARVDEAVFIAGELLAMEKSVGGFTNKGLAIIALVPWITSVTSG